MDWAFFVVFEVFVLGAALFVLLLVSRGIQAARSAEMPVEAQPDREVAQVPRFFARPGGSPRISPRPTVDDLAVLRFEQYLQTERALAEEFVSQPSLASLYRDSERCLRLN